MLPYTTIANSVEPPDPVSPNLREKFNFDIESLRGFAAVFVVWHHIHVFGYMLDAGYRPSYLLYYGPSGHFCVLIFFILSGYVIGQSNRKPLSWATSSDYLKKRLVRLYPILLLMLGFAILVNPLYKHFSWGTILGNVAMLQGLILPDINPPSWSLHYEMLYYLLFIPVSIFRFRPLAVAGAALVIGIGNYLLYPALHTPIISSYCYGLIFWLLGLFMSQRLAHVSLAKASYQVLLSCLLFMLCIDQYNVLATLMRNFIPVAFPADIVRDQVAIDFYDLAALPLAVLIILVFIGKKLPHRLLLLKGLLVASALPKLVYVVTHATRPGFDWPLYGVPTAFLGAALLCLFIQSSWLERVGQAVMKIGAKLGQLSYGMYLAHFPLLFLFTHFRAFSGTGLTFAVRVVVFLGMTLALSYWLERVLQPRLKALFFPQAAARRAPGILAEQELP